MATGEEPSPLRRLTAPADLRALTADELAALAADIRHHLVQQVSKRGGHLGPEPRRRRTDPGAAPGLRLARAIRSCSTPGTRRTCTRSSPVGPTTSTAAHPGRPVRVSEPRRVRARLGRELPRVDVAVLRRRAGQGVRAARRASSHRGRGDRRRRADRRHGLGGAEQHRRGQGPAAGDRAERQRPLVRADHRWDGPADGGAAAAAGLRADARSGEGDAAAGAGRRPAAVLRAARGEVGGEGLVRAADDVRRPRPEVRRTRRRARPAGAGDRAAERARTSAARCSCTASPARDRATRRRSPTTPSRCTRRRRSTRRPGGRGRRARRPGRRSSAGRWSSPARSGRTSWRSPRRCAGRPGSRRSRPRSRSGSSTSASPSNTR